MRIHKIILFALIVFMPFTGIMAGSDPVFIGSFKSMTRNKHGIQVKTDNAIVEIIHCSPTVIRVRVDQKELAPDFSYAVIREAEGTFKDIKEQKDSIILSTDSLQVIVNKKPFRIKFLNSSGRILSGDYQDLGISWQGTQVTCYKRLFPDEKFIGLGEKTGPLNRRGNAYENWNSDVPAYSSRQDPLYVTIPFYIGIHDGVYYGIFLDNSFRTKFNFGASTDDAFSSFSAADGEMNYYFFGAKTIPGIIRDYTGLTGRMNLPPYWSLGYQQSRWSYYPESEVLNLAKTFRDKKIPCDVIYLDIDYMDNYKIFTWNKERFPDPKSMTTKLNEMGFHLATIVDPGIKIEKGYPNYDYGIKNDCFIKYPNGQNYIGSVWPGRCHFPDFTDPRVRKWWGGSFTPLTDAGVEGFWNDMNEPSAWGQNIPEMIRFNFDGHHATMAEAHNVYGLNMSRATYEGTKQVLGGRRPFVLTRAAYAGIQRYSAVWTGDNQSTDEDMLMSVRIVNSMGVSGISFAGPDLGGFTGKPSKELFTRWISLGVYTPFMRNHTEISSPRKEPWSFGPQTEALTKQWIGTRYRLLPYLYSEFYESTLSGMPVARTLAIRYPEDPKIWENDYQNEYLFGEAILVAPVSSKDTSCKVYFPEGGWYRMGTDQFYPGNSEAMVSSPLDDLPVFVKTGGIVPMETIIQSTSEKPAHTVELHIYNGTSPSSFLYYEDDGATFDYQNGNYYRRLITLDPVNRTVTLAKAEGTYTSKFTNVLLIFHDFGDFKSMKVNGHPQETRAKTTKFRFSKTTLTNDEIVINF